MLLLLIPLVLLFMKNRSPPPLLRFQTRISSNMQVKMMIQLVAIVCGVVSVVQAMSDICKRLNYISVVYSKIPL